MKKIIGLLLLALWASACTKVYFEEAQPKGVSAESFLPPNFQGMYVYPKHGKNAPNDTSILASNYYRQIEYSVTQLSKATVDTNLNYRLEGEHFLIKKDNGHEEVYDYRAFKDSIAYWKRSDEINKLSDSLVYKSYKGYHFINIREEDGWMTLLMRKNEQGDILLTGIDDEAIEAIQMFTEVKTIFEENGKTIKYYSIAPKRKELLQLIGAGLFESEGMTFEEKFRVKSGD